MVWFLIGLIRDGAPSVCYWVVPVRQEPEREMFEVINGYDEFCRVLEGKCSAHYLKSLENESHAQEESGPGLIALDVRLAPARLGWRSIQNGVSVFREPRF